MGQYHQYFLRTSNINDCAPEGTCLIAKQRKIKKNMRICFVIKVTQTKQIQSILETIFECLLTQNTQTEVQSFEIFNPFAILPLKCTIWGRSNENLNKLLLKTRRIAALQGLGSRLIHPLIKHKTNEILKKVCIV